MLKPDKLQIQSRRGPRKSSRQSDPRSLRSREALQAGLLRLIQSRPFEQITLREITAEAGVSYPTFFNHYDSKDDLFQAIARQEIAGLLEAFRDHRDAPQWRPGESICAYVVARKSLWRTLLTAGASEAMRSEFIRRGRELGDDRPLLAHGFPVDLVSGVIASGIFEIVSWWLSQELPPPIQSISNMLETLVIEPALGQTPGYFTSRRAK